MGIWPHTLYAYPEEAHWYVTAVATLGSIQRRSTQCAFFFSGILSGSGLALI